MRLFVFGAGYAASAAMAALTGSDPHAAVTGTNRQAGRDGHVFSGEAPGATLGPDLGAATHLLVSIAPDADGDPVLRHHRADILAAPSLGWIGYYSTIGVYGDAGGAWITEAAPTPPATGRAARRLEAEAAWRALAAEKDVPLLVLRLAGIYGPGRSAFDKLRQGSARRIVKPGQVFNRIHRDDIAAATLLAARSRASGLFNLADDEPAPPQDVIAHAARLLGVPAPPEIPFEAAPMSPMARSFYGANRRVDNRPVKAALGLTLRHPTYREGLAAILVAESGGD